MTHEKQEGPKKQAPKKDRFQEEFKDLPLEEKIKTLLKMEAITLQETFNYGLNESMKAADRLGEVLAEFGKKIEAEFKNVTHSGKESTAKSKPDESKKPPPKSQKA
ncbi:MAG: hypothetical protein IPL32_16150 [Chloracidobacterium sp.]|nr:hypothetical protein [Chloracidobacterium sp.]